MSRCGFCRANGTRGLHNHAPTSGQDVRESNVVCVTRPCGGKAPRRRERRRATFADARRRFQHPISPSSNWPPHTPAPPRAPGLRRDMPRRDRPLSDRLGLGCRSRHPKEQVLSVPLPSEHRAIALTQPAFRRTFSSSLQVVERCSGTARATRLELSSSLGRRTSAPAAASTSVERVELQLGNGVCGVGSVDPLSWSALGDLICGTSEIREIAAISTDRWHAVSVRESPNSTGDRADGIWRPWVSFPPSERSNAGPQAFSVDRTSDSRAIRPIQAPPDSGRRQYE